MDWIFDLSQKLATSLDTEGVMAMREDAFDFVQHQLQTVGNVVENQFQTVSANIENHMQKIRANIELCCSSSNLDESKSVSVGRKNALKSPVPSFNLKLPYHKIIEPMAPESPKLVSGKPSAFLDDSDESDSKLADLGDEDASAFVVDSDEYSKLPFSEYEIVEPTAQALLSETNSDSDNSYLDNSDTGGGNSDSDDTCFENKYLDLSDPENSNLDNSDSDGDNPDSDDSCFIKKYLNLDPDNLYLDNSESDGDNSDSDDSCFIKKNLNLDPDDSYLDNSDSDGDNTDSDDTCFDNKYLDDFDPDNSCSDNLDSDGDNSDSDDFSFNKKYVEGPKYLTFPDDLGFDDFEKRYEEGPNLHDVASCIDEELTLCRKKINSVSNEKVTCKSFAAQANEQEHEQPTPDKKVHNFDSNKFAEISSDSETVDSEESSESETLSKKKVLNYVFNELAAEISSDTETVDSDESSDTETVDSDESSESETLDREEISESEKKVLNYVLNELAAEISSDTETVDSGESSDSETLDLEEILDSDTLDLEEISDSDTVESLISETTEIDFDFCDSDWEVV